MNKTRGVVWGVCGVVFLMAALLGLFCWSMNSKPVAPEIAQKVVAGLAREDVQEMLGEPYQKYSGNAGGEVWVYGHWFQWNSFTVHFDTEGKVVEAYYDD